MTPTPPANADQVDYWNGDVGQRWAHNQQLLDTAFSPITAALLDTAAPQPGERAIDVGCGCGDLSLAIADRIGPAGTVIDPAAGTVIDPAAGTVIDPAAGTVIDPAAGTVIGPAAGTVIGPAGTVIDPAAGTVIAIDVSRPMLDVARARATNRPAIRWQQADAATAAFPPAGADLVASRFGCMFFTDPAAAFRNLRQALRPGGRLAIMCWQPMPDNPWVALPRAAMLRHLPPPAPTPPHAPGPFAFADAAYVGAILATAGFAAIASTAIRTPLGLPPGDVDQATAFVTENGPAAALLRGAGPEPAARAIEAVRTALTRRAAANQPLLEAACWLFTATNPPG